MAHNHEAQSCVLTLQIVFAAAVVPVTVKVEVQGTHPVSGGKEFCTYASYGAVFG